jgi:hypothetical protein
MTRNKLYRLVLIACFVGFIYLLYSVYYKSNSQTTVCFFKNVTGISCPSCGTTTAIILLLRGAFIASFLKNPFGILVFGILFVSPIWIFLDILNQKNSFYQTYCKLEQKIKSPIIAAVLILLVLLNWYYILN